jgi:hypothetical protein
MHGRIRETDIRDHVASLCDPHFLLHFSSSYSFTHAALRSVFLEIVGGVVECRGRCRTGNWSRFWIEATELPAPSALLRVCWLRGCATTYEVIPASAKALGKLEKSRWKRWQRLLERVTVLKISEATFFRTVALFIRKTSGLLKGKTHLKLGPGMTDLLIGQMYIFGRQQDVALQPRGRSGSLLSDAGLDLVGSCFTLWLRMWHGRIVHVRSTSKSHRRALFDRSPAAVLFVKEPRRTLDQIAIF